MKPVSKDPKPQFRDTQTLILFGVLGFMTVVFVLFLKWVVLTPASSPGVQRTPAASVPEEAVGSR